MIVPPTTLQRSGSATMPVDDPASNSYSSSSSSSSMTSSCLIQAAPVVGVGGGSIIMSSSNSRRSNNKKATTKKQHVQQKQQQVKKSVTFHDKVKMRKVRKLTDYDETMSITDLWYTSDELQDTYETQVYDVVDLMEVQDYDMIQQLGMCSRGLESKTTAGYQHKYETRYYAINVVLEEQCRQWKLYDTNHIIHLDVVAEKYSQASYEAKQIAYQVALQDQQDVLLFNEQKEQRQQERRESLLL